MFFLSYKVTYLRCLSKNGELSTDETTLHYYFIMIMRCVKSWSELKISKCGVILSISDFGDLNIHGSSSDQLI